MPDVQHMEGLLPKKYGNDAVEIPGARALLQDLIDRKKPWAIVTSGTYPLVSGVSEFALSLHLPPSLDFCKLCSNKCPARFLHSPFSHIYTYLTPHKSLCRFLGVMHHFIRAFCY